jgi:hypothetical protein
MAIRPIVKHEMGPKSKAGRPPASGENPDINPDFRASAGF